MHNLPILQTRFHYFLTSLSFHMNYNNNVSEWHQSTRKLTFPLLNIKFSAFKGLIIRICHWLIIWVMILRKIAVGQSFSSSDPFICVQHQHLLQQIYSFRSQEKKTKKGINMQFLMKSQLNLKKISISQCQYAAIRFVCKKNMSLISIKQHSKKKVLLRKVLKI